jgi:class 3 adenylate cyclase/CheY-like chemotaxis protein
MVGVQGQHQLQLSGYSVADSHESREDRTVSTRVRTVTVLFTDIVDSTELFDLLGAGAEELRGRHFSAMRAALAVHRGIEVKTLGDGVMAAFDGAGDSLGCAVTMQRAIARHNLRHPEQAVRIRIGLSSGEATEEDGDYFGVPVVEASRLCARADAGQILVSEVTRTLVRGGTMHRLEPVGEIDLKGLPTPASAFELDWNPDEDTELRVALADDSVLLRQGIAQLLESEGIAVVLQVGDAESLLDRLAATDPHVVVVDVRMPPTHTTEGLQAAEFIRSEYPDIGVLVLSQSIEPGAARRLLEGATGGVGYLLKERVTDVGELTAAIRTIAGGGSVIDPGVVARLEAAQSGATRR